jgi:hypothetical protein
VCFVSVIAPLSLTARSLRPAIRSRTVSGVWLPALACVVVTTLFSAEAAGTTASTPTPALRDGLVAWESVYSVLTYPRCLNCHTATTYPQQGDDRHRHVANVVRGPEGKGVPGLHCAGCHGEVNADSTGVPGGPNWHLAPLSMQWQTTTDQPMSSAEVCRAVTDRAKNHGLDRPGLLKHHEEEPLVLWAWKPGNRPDGSTRALPPLTHAEFVTATRRWVEAGMPCPP